MDGITPLFIMGMGRSGTTNALRVASAHPEIMLNGEISLAVVKQFFALLEQLERSYGKRDAMRDGWFERKADYIFSSFGYLAKGGRGKLERGSTARFRGHKAPRLETMFDSYEAHFASVGLKPRYFYCARNAFDCWRSYRNQNWNSYDAVGRFLEHYMASFETLKRIRAEVPDRVFVLNLDELKASGDPVGFYRTRLFAPLGLELPERVARKIGNFAELKKPAEHAPLDSADDRAIADYPGMRALYGEMFSAHLTRALP
ncbi:MAG TPA: sulfotransferase [Rhizomicrobium sp.]|nr:sulfotransferase [Rhizomicrobium sp.]